MSQSALAPGSSGSLLARLTSIRFGLMPAAVMVWAFWAIGNLIARGGDAASGHLLDTDDYMHLVQWRDLLAGQGWFDLHQHRYVGPEGGDIHFSRLPDLMMSVYDFFLRPFAGAENAERMTIIAYPVTLFLGFIAASAVAARRIGGIRAGFAIIIFSTLSLIVTMQFAPGRLDHHGLALTLAVASFAAALISFEKPRYAALAAIASVFAGAVSLEIAPILVAIAPAISLPFIFKGERKALRAFGAAMLLSAPVLLVALKGPLIFSDLHCDTYETPAASGFFAIGAIAFALSWSNFKSVRSRIFFAGALAAGAGAVLLAVYPQCAGGPFDGMDPVVRDVWLQSVNEMQPPAALAKSQPELLLGLYVIPFLGLATAAFALYRAKDEERLVIGAMAIVAAAAAIMIIPAARGVYIATAFAAFPLALAIANVSRRVRFNPLENGALFIAACLIFTPSLYLAASAELKNMREEPQEDGEAANAECNVPSALAALGTLDPSVLFTELDNGPMILAHTGHSVTAAPYHRNNQAIKRAIEFFTGDDATARAALRASGARYLVFCPASGESKRYASIAPEGLSARLLNGAPPAWLTRVPLAAAAPIEIFELTTP